jgi:hypothetical protein
MKPRGDLVTAALLPALHATGPDASLSDRLATFGRFVGAWDLEWHGTGHDGTDIVVRGEVEEVLLDHLVAVPLHRPHRGDMASNAVGAAVYDHRARCRWLSTWNPSPTATP